MPRYQVYMWLLTGTWGLFVFAFGACVGSLINVVAYRMPKGLSIVRPPSRCPSCATKLGWRDNIPILGWIVLRGRCRYCATRISPQYPIVEAAVASLFLLFFVAFLGIDRGASLAGVDIGLVRPEWALNEVRLIWPAFLVVLALIGSLSAMTLVDAKTFTIPLVLAWFPAVLAVIVHPAHAAWIEFASPYGRLPRVAEHEVWSIATPGLGGWEWIGGSIGGVIGIGVSCVLVATGVLKRSFADYDEWERKALAQANGPQASPPPPDSTGVSSASTEPQALPQAPVEAAVATAEPPSAPTPDAQAELWIQYPYARREVLREILFLAPCLALGFVGMKIATHYAGPWTLNAFTGDWTPAREAPLWLTVLGGVLMGYLIGGGVVWGIRILGSLAFGKEAMGMGDVHLMAGVGACLGWIDAVLAFFLAAFVGVFWAIVSQLFSGKLRRQMPYGPFLAIATVLVLLTKPLLESLLGRLTGAGWVDLP